MKTNQMKVLLAKDEPAFGLSIMFPSPQMVEMAKPLGFDWVLIDCEHGSISIESAELMIMAAEAAGLTPIVRPPSNTAREISQMMDLGAMGVQVPHVITADDARKAVSAVKYHPQGKRSMAAGIRAQGYGVSKGSDDYIKEANEQTLVCVQIEDEEALQNVDEILQVEGIDIFFIGPSDLSQSMGFPGNPKAPKVADAIDATLAKIVAAGHTPGMPAATDAVQAALSKGVRYIYTHVPKLIGPAASSYFKAARG